MFIENRAGVDFCLLGGSKFKPEIFVFQVRRRGLAFYPQKEVRQATLAIACLYLNLTHLL